MTAAGNTQLFFELSVDMHCIASPDAKMLHVNSRWEKVLGYTVAELKAGSFLDLVHPDDVTQTLGAMEQLNSGQTVANFSNRYRRKDGKYLDLDWSAILNQEDGLYYATARDVTLAKDTTRRLASTNRILSSINHARDLYVEQGMNAQWWDQMLNDVLELTSSEYGFIGAIEEDGDGRFLRTFAITDISWDDATREFFLSGREQGLEFRNLKTLFGEVIVTEEHVIANDVASDPRAAGRPHGHPPLNRFMGLALHGVGGMVGMIGVANRADGYDEALIADLHPVINFLGALIESQGRKVREQSTDARFQELQELNSLILEASTSFIFAMDPNGLCLSANKATRELFGVSDESFVPHLITLTMLRKSEEWFSQQLKHIDEAGRVVVELSLPKAAGGSITCEFTLTRLQGAHGKLQGVLFVGNDLTMRKTLEASAVEHAKLISRVDALRKRQNEDEIVSACVDYLLNCSSLEESHQIVFRHLKELYADAVVEVCTFDKTAEVLEQQWPQIEGEELCFPLVDCWAMRSRRLHAWWEDSAKMRCQHHTDSEDTMVVCAPLQSYENIFGLIALRFKDHGGLGRQQLTVRADARIKRFGEICQRISVAIAMVELKVRLEQAALTDSLTGVNNRRAFEQEVARSVARARRHGQAFAIVLIDIDHFKQVNDELGHDVGDQVLRGIVTKVRENVRTSDAIGRLGGEEFGVLLEGVSPDEAVIKAERLREEVAAGVWAANRSVTASFGVAHSAKAETVTWKCLYTSADKALFRAKAAGRNAVHCAWKH